MLTVRSIISIVDKREYCCWIKSQLKGRKINLCSNTKNMPLINILSSRPYFVPRQRSVSLSKSSMVFLIPAASMEELVVLKYYLHHLEIDVGNKTYNNICI